MEKERRGMGERLEIGEWVDELPRLYKREI